MLISKSMRWWHCFLRTPIRWAPNCDVGQPSSECIVSIRFLAHGPESLDVGRNCIFVDIEADAGPIAELFHYIKECDHFFDGIGDQRAIVGLPFTGQSEAT